MLIVEWETSATRVSFWFSWINSRYLFHKYFLNFYYGPGTVHIFLLILPATEPVMLFLIKLYMFIFVSLLINKTFIIVIIELKLIFIK